MAALCAKCKYCHKPKLKQKQTYSIVQAYILFIKCYKLCLHTYKVFPNNYYLFVESNFQVSHKLYTYVCVCVCVCVRNGGEKTPGRRHGDVRHPRRGSKLAVSELPPYSVHTPACTLPVLHYVQY